MGRDALTVINKWYDDIMHNRKLTSDRYRAVEYDAQLTLLKQLKKDLTKVKK